MSSAAISLVALRIDFIDCRNIFLSSFLYHFLILCLSYIGLEEDEGDCFEDPFLYAGYVNTTVSGFACESWAKYSGKSSFGFKLIFT